MNEHSLPPLEALEIVVNPHLTGTEEAIRFGDKAQVQVSPALWELMKGATPDELQALLSGVRVVQLPPLPSLLDPPPPVAEWVRERARFSNSG